MLGVIDLHPQITKTIRHLLRLWNQQGIFNIHFKIEKLVFFQKLNLAGLKSLKFYNKH